MRRRYGLALAFLSAAVILSSQWVTAAPPIVPDRSSGVIISVPEGWVPVRRLGATSAFISPDERASVTISMVKSNLNDLDQIYRNFMQAAPRNYQGFQLIGAERRSIKGKAVLILTFDFATGYRFRQQHLKIQRPGGYVDVVFSVFAEDWPTYGPVFKNMQSTMEFSF